MTEPNILIVGAGVAGLAAGCYARMNGYRSTIFELHFLPGGLCTSWRRGDYVFDGGVRYLTGTQPTTRVHQLWSELGLLSARPIHYYDEFTRYIGADGRTFCLYTDIDRLEAHMLALAPQDEDPILDFTRALRAFRQLDLPVDLTPTEPLEALELGRGVFRALPALLTWSRMTSAEFAMRFKDPLLRAALPNLFQFAPPDFPAMLILSLIAMLNDREAGYPIGGSLQFAEDLARRYLALGGQIRYKSRVARILTEASEDDAPDRAIGVQLTDGSQHYGDIVISACDGRSAIFDMLQGRYANDTLRAYYRDLPLAKSLLQVSLGVVRDFSAEPPSVDFPLPQPIIIGNIPHQRLVLKHYCFDPTVAPAGHSVLSLWCEADYDYWAGLHADRARYTAAKDAAAEQIIAALDARYPGLRAAVEVVDVATPLTYERYTANWRGAFSGWALTTRKMSMMMGKGMSKQLPGLKDFYMIGQWVEPGGNVELSAASGRDVIKDICKSADRPFVTTA